ncbi:uncharacterized protein LOC105923478 isoform X1 [Fundulus heteroclitus]|uniref:uncharacterized protein LOC105923478 isoform X1 n=2 Tax=Fundulus heteroclitus TaxID=8078 RepID=UPI00165BA8CB|nr:uncharacterized protein LOC105923478 isoform X1 [Fundulus heteroclitus]
MKVLLLLVGILLHGSLQVQQVLQVKEGDPMVLLPCEYPTFEVDNATVVWTRSDLTPSTVHRRQEHRDELKDQNQLYEGRTSMKAEALEKGELDLALTRLQLSDTGIYSCSIRDIREELRRTHVELLVDGGFPTWATVLLVLLCLLVLCVSGGVLFHFRTYFMEEYRVPLEYGVDSVLLPCRTTARLPGDVRVEWTDKINRIVHVYEGGTDQTEEQNRFYKNRTLMEKKLKSGDLSLTLKHPTDEDENIYTCSVLSKAGHVLVKKQVHLQIRGSKKQRSSFI